MARQKSRGQVTKKSVLVGTYVSQEVRALLEMRVSEQNLTVSDYLRSLIERDLALDGDPVSAGWRVGCRQGYAKFMRELSLLLKRVSEDVDICVEE